MAKQQWLALQNLVVPRGPEWLVVSGAVLDDHDRVTWHPAVNQAVAYTPVGHAKIVQAGSVFEADLPKTRVRIWQSVGALGDPAQTRHFDLEQVLGGNTSYLGKAATLAEVLRAHGIYTLEGVAANESGTIPFSETSTPDGQPVPITAQELLTEFAGADALPDLLEDVQAAIQA